jgi:hypothetical protein
VVPALFVLKRTPAVLAYNFAEYFDERRAMMQQWAVIWTSTGREQK